MVEIGEDFTYFTYEEYDKMLDLMLFNLYKNTYVCKDDIKQDLMIFILKLEKKIKDKKIDNIDNVKGYIVHCLKMKTINVCKKFFSDMIKNNFIDIMEYESYLVNCDNINVERDLVNKQYLNDLFEYYQVKEEDRLLLLHSRSNTTKNERYLLLKWLKRKINKNDRWRI